MPKVAEREVYLRPGSKFYQLRYTTSDGTEVRKSSGTEDFEIAKRQLEKLKSGSGLTLQSLCVRFFEEHEMSTQTRRCYKSSLKAWLPLICPLMIEQMTASIIQKFVSTRLKQVRHGTIRNDLAFMSSLMSFACMLPGGPVVNPVAAFNKKHLKKPEERVRYLSPVELRLITEQITNPTFKLIFLVATETGLRKMEILNLRVRDLDMEGAEATHKILIRGERSKTKRGRVVPVSRTLSRALTAYIKEHKLKGMDDLFTNPETKTTYYDVRPWFTNAIEAVGIEDFHFHDLRHHFASTYAQRGGRLQPLQEILGHTSLQMVQRYAHLSPGDTEREFRRLEEGLQVVINE
jgi:integrase